jgi:hypothetical protein
VSAATPSPPAACPRCGAPRVTGPDCPHCGVLYARADERAARRPAAGSSPVPETSGPSAPAGRPSPPSGPSEAAKWALGNRIAEARSELVLARFAVPGALLTSWILIHTDMGRFLMRLLLSMWLHESGHAAAAWLCGYLAFPGPWFTPVAEERSFLFALAISAGLGYAIWRAWTNDQRVRAGAFMALLGAQWFATFVLRETTAHTFITFAGDGGMLVFGAALLAAFFVPPGHKLHRDWLRWGFLVIGSASFADSFYEWWSARRDPSLIAFGEIEGRGDTDPTVLLQAGWTIDRMVGRYLALGVLSLLVLAVLQVRHVRRTRAALDAVERGEEPEDRSA